MRTLCSAAGLALALAATNASAQTPTPARALAQEGKALVDAGNYDAGCPKLEEAWKMDSELLGAGFSLGECYERQGKLASAQTQFTTVATKAAMRGEPRAAEAKSRADALAPRVSTITIKVPDAIASAPGLEVMLDDQVVSKSSFNTPLPKDGGRYRLTVNASGKQTWAKALEVPNERGRLEIVAELAGAGEREAAPPPRHGGGQPAGSSGGMPPLRIAGATITAVGGAGIVLGITFGVLAMKRRDDSNQDGLCDPETNFCSDQKGVDLRAKSRLFGNVSTAMFVVGGVAAAAGIVMLVVPIGGSSVRAALSPSYAGLSGEF